MRTFILPIVLAVAIKHGNGVYENKVEGATAADGLLDVKYTANGKGADDLSRFASPLIITADKQDDKSVAFMSEF
jgi:hypothetical protein